MIRHLTHIVSEIHCRPLLIHSVKLEGLLVGLRAAMLQRGSSVLPPLAESPAVDTPAAERPRGYTIDRGVALLPVHGVLVTRAGQIAADSTEFQSYQRLSGALHRARNDSRVRAILLHVDSPGGQAGGIFDFTQQIRATAKLKPVWAIANEDALSAGYAIAAAADKVWVTDTGSVGSVGVLAMHIDQSRFDAEEGISYSYIYRGDRKIDGNPHEPLSLEARVTIQAEVDRLATKLYESTGQHRGIEPGRLRATEARIYHDSEARELGLVDRVGTLEQAHAELADHLVTPARRGATRMENTENVVNLDDVRAAAATAATAEILALAEGINAYCTLAGHPELAGAYIANRTPLAAVQKELLELRARKAQATQVETLDTSATSIAPRGSTSTDAQTANAERFRLYQTRIA
jgi:signal peptide peptidase SppA